MPEDETDITALAEIIQNSINALLAKGINKISLMAHMQQISIEETIAPMLEDVDIIVAGGSDTLLADETDRLREGDTAKGTYPLIATSAIGEPTAIVNTDGNYKYVGHLVVEFGLRGFILTNTIAPNISGTYATNAQGVADTGNVDPNERVFEIASALDEIIIAKDGNTFGKTDVYINGLRSSVRTEETTLSNLSADINLAAVRKYDPTTAVSIKNGANLNAGLNMISLPLTPTEPYTARTFIEKLGATMVIE